MCIRDANGEDHGLHECIVECPLCWIFLSAYNKHALITGARIELGTAYELMYAAQEGCHFASLWLDRLLATAHGPNYSSESKIWAFVPEEGRSFPADIRMLTLAIRDSDGVVSDLGDGAVETVYHGHEDTFGVFAWQGSLSGASITQRFAQPVVDQPRAYEDARKWIAECLFDHERCPKPDLAAPLPTRVLDVRTGNGHEEARVKLFVGEGLCAQYAALSYCWGRTPQLTTTQTRLPSFIKDGIDVSKLPQTLQDAIAVTRKLGIPYLWIDSLCIIQDSDDDKAREITKMPQIYKGAITTISAAIARDCGEGFLQRREEVQALLNTSFSLEYLLDDENAPGVESVQGVDKEDTDGIFVCADSDCGYKIKDFDEEPINQRAWTLQESWLAPRLLIYGSGPLQWQCLSRSASFGGMPPSRPRPTVTSLLTIGDGLDMGREDSFLPVEARRKFFDNSNPVVSRSRLADQWRDIVRQYTRRTMTDPGDKLPALSGIAAEFGRLSGDVYLAGLWKSSLPYGLLWHQLSKPPAGTKEVGGYRAPSWSWASVDGAISIGSPKTWIGTTEMVIESVETSPLTSLAPLGKVIAGKLTVTGPVRRMSWEKVQERYVILDLDQSAHLYWDYIIPDNGLLNPRFPNPRKNSQYTQASERVTVSVYPPASITPVPRSAPTKSISDALDAMTIAEDGSYVFLEVTRAPEPTGIVLEALPDGLHKRIGYFLMGRRATSLDEQRDGFWSAGERDWNWDAGLEICTLTIV